MKLKCERGRQQEYEDENGKRRWSVSECLSVLDPHAFDGVDPFILASAQDRGKSLHVLLAVTLLARRGLCEPPAKPTGIIGIYYSGIEKFCRERNPQPIKVEQSSVNDSMGYAGTPDTECWLDDTDSLIDLKTGPPRAVHGAQLHAYKRMEGYEKVKRLYSLYINKDGGYKLVEHTHDHLAWSWFQAGLSVLNGRKHHGLK